MLDLTSRRDLVQLAEDLAPLARQASALGLEWMLFGAQARDIVLEVAGLRPVGRATLDVDVAVEVGTWGEYERLKSSLVDEEGASIDPNVAHRLELAGGTTLDVVPFGAIEANGNIAWPPHGDRVLRVVGLTDARQAATTVILPAKLEVLVPSLPAYVGLKLLAWESRQAEGIEQDAIDLAGILDGLDELIPLEKLYSDHGPVMEASDFDPTLACTEILGHRMAAELSTPFRTAVTEVLRREIVPLGRLDLVRQLGLDNRALPFLRALARGLEETRS